MQPCAVHKEKTVGYFRHLTVITCFKRLGSAFPTSNTLLVLPLFQGDSWLQLHCCTMVHPPKTTWEGALPVAWLCWALLSFPMQLDMPIVSQHRGMLLYQAAAVLQGPKISTGVKPPGKAAREQGKIETSTELPLPLSPTCQSLVPNQLQRGASAPHQGGGGTFLEPGLVLVPGCSPQQTLEALAQPSQM